MNRPSVVAGLCADFYFYNSSGQMISRGSHRENADQQVDYLYNWRLYLAVAGGKSKFDGKKLMSSGHSMKQKRTNCTPTAFISKPTLQQSLM